MCIRDRYKWESRSGYHIEKETLGNESLVPADSFIFPVLHIKLVMIANFVEALNPSRNAMASIIKNFPNLITAKINTSISSHSSRKCINLLCIGVMIGSQIRKMMQITKLVNDTEKRGVDVCV